VPDPAAAGWFDAWEACLSRFRSDSELARLNRRPGRLVAVSATLWDVLQTALEAAAWSDGLVVPTVLGAMRSAGYDRSFELLAAGSAPAGHAPARPAVGDWRAISTIDHGRRVRCQGNLDLGGVAKGWAADTAAARLAGRGPALVDAGGDIAVNGPRADGSGWPIGVPHPLDSQLQIALIWLAGGGVATSGIDHRRWRRDGREMHHIIDPRTGHPARSDVVSATVIAPSAVDAEVAAKCALILGSAAGIAWLDERPLFAGLLVRADGSVVESRRFAEYRWPAAVALGAEAT
jgi:thiamine biosynthesis lipoprotein